MRVLLVVDGSSHSDMATKMVETLQLPPQTKVIAMTVIPEYTFLGGITLGSLIGAGQTREKLQDTQQEKALALLQRTEQALSTTRLKVDSLVRWGNPAEVILSVANEENISLVIIGAKGLSDPLSFHLGSVATAVSKHANTSVLLVRQTTSISKQVSSCQKKAAINRVLLATDGSKYSDMTTQFLLDLPLPQHTEVIVITALQSHRAAWINTPTLDFRINQELLASLQEAEENEASKITAKSEKQFQTKGYKTTSAVLRGGAAESILAAAKEHKPDIIAMGSRGLSGIEPILLGSVAERVARYADYPVLIGRLPGKIRE